MSDQPRPLPSRPNLRHLKLEAKRRLAAGEFATLHDAQLAIAREYGRSSWTALKQHIESQAAQSPTHALDQVAAGGLWSTAADLIRFARAWRGLLPADLADEAFRPQASRPADGVQIGLGWMINQARGVAGHPGGGRGGSSSLIVAADGRIHLALANRLVRIEKINARVLKAARQAGGPPAPPGAR